LALALLRIRKKYTDETNYIIKTGNKIMSNAQIITKGQNQLTTIINRLKARLLFIFTMLVLLLPLCFSAQKQLSHSDLFTNKTIHTIISNSFNTRDYDAFEVSSIGDDNCQIRPQRLFDLFKLKTFDDVDKDGQQFLKLCHAMNQCGTAVRDEFQIEFMELMNQKISYENLSFTKTAVNRMKQELAALTVQFAKTSNSNNYDIVTTNCSGKVRGSTMPTFQMMMDKSDRDSMPLFFLMTRLKVEGKEFIRDGSELLPMNQFTQNAHVLQTDPIVVIQGYSIQNSSVQVDFKGILKMINEANNFEQFKNILKCETLQNLCLCNASLMDHMVEKESMNLLSKEFIKNTQSMGMEFLDYIENRKSKDGLKRSLKPMPFMITHVLLSTMEKQKKIMDSQALRSSMIINTNNDEKQMHNLKK
jgi:hypothetical protein